MSKKNAKGVVRSFPTIDGLVKSPSVGLLVHVMYLNDEMSGSGSAAIYIYFYNNFSKN